MQQPRFLILTGHLDDYPMSVLFSILRHQRKTGRLLIEYQMHPGIFYFREGELVDAQFNSLNGLQAAFVAFSQPNAAFNFNPLIKPPGRSIDSPSQKVILELLGCWEEHVLDVQATIQQGARHSPDATPTPALYEAHQAALAEPKEVLALPASTGARSALALVSSLPDQMRVKSKQRILIACALVLLVGIPALIFLIAGRSPKSLAIPRTVESSNALPAESPSSNASESVANALPRTGGSTGANSTPPRERHQDQSREHLQNHELQRDEMVRAELLKKDATPPTPAQKDAIQPAATGAGSQPSPKKSNNEANSNQQTVKVVLQIENGHVLQAAVANRRPGMEAYEALALRIARQRRYPAKAGGQETMTIKVGPQ